jgi:hypothetical protein
LEVQGWNFSPHVCTLLSQNSDCTQGQFKAVTITTAAGGVVAIFGSPQTMGLSLKKCKRDFFFCGALAHFQAIVTIFLWFSILLCGQILGSYSKIGHGHFHVILDL